jgi:hypothetical protein
LLEHLLGNSVDTAATDDIVAQYRAAFLEAQASEQERDSVLNQFDFIDKMATQLEGGPRGRTLSAVRRIREQLAEPPKAAAPAAARGEAGATKKPATRKPAPQKPGRKPAAKGKARVKRKKPGLS